MPYLRPLTGCTLLVALAGCGADSTSPSPTAHVNTNALVARTSAVSAANDVSYMQIGSLLLSRSHQAALDATPASPAELGDPLLGALDCRYNESVQRFVCSSVTLNNLTLSGEFILYDQQNNPQSAYDDETTSSADIFFTALGTIANPEDAANIARLRSLHLSGIRGSAASRTFDGTGQDSVTGVLSGDGSTYVLRDTTAVQGVVIGLPYADHQWPLAGTLTTRTVLELTSNGSTAVSHRHVVVTFEGNQRVKMVVDGDSSSTTTYTLDLATGEIVVAP